MHRITLQEVIECFALNWTVPTDAAGQMLDFQFSGTVSDKPCAVHKASARLIGLRQWR